MVTATTCEKCWNERQSLGGVVFHNIKTGEIWTLEVNICGTCRREITNVVSFLRFHGATVVQQVFESIEADEGTPVPDDVSLKEEKPENLTGYEETVSKTSSKPKAKP